MKNSAIILIRHYQNDSFLLEHPNEKLVQITEHQ